MLLKRTFNATRLTHAYSCCCRGDPPFLGLLLYHSGNTGTGSIIICNQHAHAGSTQQWRCNINIASQVQIRYTSKYNMNTTVYHDRGDRDPGRDVTDGLMLLNIYIYIWLSGSIGPASCSWLIYDATAVAVPLHMYQGLSARPHALDWLTMPQQ